MENSSCLMCYQCTMVTNVGQDEYCRGFDSDLHDMLLILIIFYTLI
jgi:hypothetical protein